MDLRAALTWLRGNLAFLLLLLTLLLFASKSLYNIPVGIMALLGVWRLISRPVLLNDPLVRLYIALFLCLWVPQLLSLTDAVNLSHSLGTVLPYLRFLFMGIYLLGEADLPGLRAKLGRAAFWVALIWSLDALIQYFAGYNLFGYPYEGAHITGIFYPDLMLTHVLAALSPLYFDTLKTWIGKYRFIWLPVLPLFAVILLGGRRAAWIMLAISMCAYVWYLYRYTDVWPRARRQIIVAMLACAAALLVLIGTNEAMQDRLVATAGLFSLDYELTDQATARRLPIWETAIAILREHWINGIGPRGFRYAYQEFSTPDNYFHEIGTTHPHQLLLEILVETGLIGLAGFVLFVWLLGRHLLARERLPRVFPAMLAVLIILFPFSTNMAFYGSYWASVSWWFLLYALLASVPERQ